MLEEVQPQPSAIEMINMERILLHGYARYGSVERCPRERVGSSGHVLSGGGGRVTSGYGRLTSAGLSGHSSSCMTSSVTSLASKFQCPSVKSLTSTRPGENYTT